MPIRQLFLTCLVASALAACAEDAPDALPAVPESMAGESSVDAAPATDAPVVADGPVRVTPPALCTGAKRQQVTVSWDVRDLGAKSVTVHIGESEEAKVFFRGGASGEKQTGNWVSPGMVFEVRDGASGAPLAKAQVQGRDC